MLSPKVFLEPPARYRPIPFWFWNSKIRADEVEAQIRDFHDKGLGGFFIHARFGLETEYLSREWMNLVETAVEAANRLGMEVWLYDENGFPSGIGNLKISRVWDYRPKFVEPTGDGGYSKRVLEDENDVIFGVDYLNPEATQAFFEMTLKPYEEALGRHFGGTIKGIFTDEPTLLPWHHNINWYGRRSDTRVVVWNDRIEQEMVRRVGMSAQEFLPHLFAQIDGATARVRWIFWETVADLYVKAFFEPYSRWCAEHNLKLTGHVLFEEGLYLNTDFQADFPRVLTYLHIPGTDHLGDVTEVAYGGFENTPRHLTNIQGQKLVSSIAHLTGREAAISETYGCAGWGLSLERMKCIADWQYCLGINMLCPHAVFYSIEGFRKWDAPPSENHMAGWKHYRRFADYIGRLSYVLRQGRHAAKVALYYPMREFRGRHTVGAEGPQDRAISDTFDLCASVLPRLHFDYDIVPESFFPQARVEDGRLCIRDEQYAVLIAPESILGSDACEKVREFESKGGKWIRPPKVTGESDREMLARALDDALRKAVEPDVRITSPEKVRLEDVRYVHRVADGKHIYFFANTSADAVEALISLEAVGTVEIWNPESGKVEPAEGVESDNGRVSVRHAFPPYGSVIYVVNPPPEGAPAGPAHSGTPRRERASAPTPSRRVVEVLPDEWRFGLEGLNALPLNHLRLSIRTHGGGSDYVYGASFRCERVPNTLMLMLDDIEYRSSLMGGMDIAVEVNGRTWRNPQFGWYLDKGMKTLDISSAVRVGENALTITIRHSAWSGQPHLLSAPPTLLGDFAVDAQRTTLLAQVVSAKSGSWTEFGYPFYSGTAAYTRSFTLPDVPADTKLIVSVDDVKDSVEIVVNGRTADVRLWRPWDADITGLVRPGENELTLKVTNSTANLLEANPRPSGLLGRVRLLREEKAD